MFNLQPFLFPLHGKVDKLLFQIFIYILQIIREMPVHDDIFNFRQFLFTERNHIRFAVRHVNGKAYRFFRIGNGPGAFCRNAVVTHVKQVDPLE